MIFTNYSNATKIAVIKLLILSMKSFAFLMCIYLLILCCLPCSDSIECNLPDRYSSSQSDDHHNHSHESENCTPFCTCSCCGLTAFFTPMPQLQICIVKDQSVNYPNFTSFIHSGVYAFIGQPPQLV